MLKIIENFEKKMKINLRT